MTLRSPAAAQDARSEEPWVRQPVLERLHKEIQAWQRAAQEAQQVSPTAIPPPSTNDFTYIFALANVEGNSTSGANPFVAVTVPASPGVSLGVAVVPWRETTEATQQLEHILTAALEEEFEDGMSSNLARDLTMYIEREGEAGIRGLEMQVDSGFISIRVLAETLRVLGKIEHQNSRSARVALLIRQLNSDSHYVRDAAGLGLSAMQDARAIPHLRLAIDHEPLDELRRDLQQVIRDLES
jgi:hypothetical protein